MASDIIVMVTGDCTCTSNPCAQAASTIFCSRDMLGMAVRDGRCVPHAEYNASLYIVFYEKKKKTKVKLVTDHDR